MAGYEAWSTTAASNTDVDGAAATDIDENNLPRTVNNALRATLANLRIFMDLLGGGIDSGGTADAQTVSTGNSWSLANQQDELIGFRAGATLTNTGAMTLAIDGAAATAVKMLDGTDPPAGAVTAGGVYYVIYDGTNYLLMNPATAGVAASATAAGVSELATAAETTTGTDAGRTVTPDGLAGSDYGKSVVSILVFNDSENCATGNGAGDMFWRVPATLNGYNLVAVAAQCQTAGTTGTMDVQIHNVTQAADMLSTVITIDTGETDTSTAATPAVIDTANDDVATGDSIRIDVDAVHSTPAKGLLVELTFQLP